MSSSPVRLVHLVVQTDRGQETRLAPFVGDGNFGKIEAALKQTKLNQGWVASVAVERASGAAGEAVGAGEATAHPQAVEARVDTERRGVLVPGGGSS